MSSWHGRVHLLAGLVCAIATIAAPFFLAPRMRRVAGWADLAGPATRFGLLLAAVLVAYAALEGKPGGGYLQRSAILLVSAGVVVLAVRVRALCQRLPIHVRQEHA